MRPPDPSRPVLYSASRQVAMYRYGVPLLLVLALVGVPLWRLSPEGREHLVPFLLPAAVLLVGYILFARHLRAATVTEPGIVVEEVGARHLVEWSDIDWATELWMNPPTLVVRLKAGLPLLPRWFLLIPPRERRFGWRAQPMSQFVAGKVREARDAHPEGALLHGRWPSRAALTFKVTGAFLLLLLGALALAMWISLEGIFDGGPRLPGTDAPITAALPIACAAHETAPGLTGHPAGPG